MKAAAQSRRVASSVFLHQKIAVPTPPPERTWKIGRALTGEDIICVISPCSQLLITQ